MKIYPQKIILLILSIFVLQSVDILSQEDTVGITFDKKIKTVYSDESNLKSLAIKFCGTGYYNAEYYFSFEKVIKSNFTFELFLGFTAGEDKIGNFHSLNSFYSYETYYQLENSHSPKMGLISKIGIKYYLGKYSLNGFYVSSQVGIKKFNSKAYKRKNGTNPNDDMFSSSFGNNKRNTLETRIGGGYQLNFNHIYNASGFFKNILIDGGFGVQFEKNKVNYFSESRNSNNIYSYDYQSVDELFLFPYFSISLGYIF